MYRLNNIKRNILIVSCVALLAGCGGGETTGSIDTTSTDTTSTDTTTPTLKVVAIQINEPITTENSVTIEWAPNGYTSKLVEYGTSKKYGSELSVKEEGTITLFNLQSNTTYHYRIVSEDKNGKKVVSRDNTFMTLEQSTQPIVSEPAPSEAVLTEPILTEPIITEPIVTEPILTEPILTEPILTEPIVTEPIVTEPIPVESNNPPEAQEVKIVGIAKVGEILTLDYQFIDIDGDSEGDSIIAWSTPTVEVQRGTSKTFEIPAELAGMELSAWVHPSDGTVVTEHGIEASNGYIQIESIPEPIATEPVLNSSSYEEVVDIPKYNPSDSTHVLITESNNNWNDTIINDPTKKHFYIEPGTYHSKVTLTQSGTESDRRTISLYNGNDTHPASLDVSEIADVRVLNKGGSYWTLDRLSNFNDTAYGSFKFYEGASHNIINRLHLKNYYYGVIVDNESNFNTVQNSYIDHMSHLGRVNDKVGLAINTQGDNNRVEGTKFINNDIRNAGDGIQLVRDDNALNINYPNTIIDGNRIWEDGDIRTNGDYATNGYNINGEYQIAENAMDLKAGSDDSNKPIIITNNMMWGYRTGDTTTGGSFSSKNGPCFVVHYNVSNVVFEDNVIFDSDLAFTMSGLMDGLPYSGENWSIKNNIFSDIHLVNPKEDKTYALYFYNAKSIEIENNIFANIPNTVGGYFLSFNGDTIDSTFKNNVAIDAQSTTTNYNVIVDNNYFYNSKQSFGGENHTYAEARDANMKEYNTFSYKRFTGNPQIKTLQSNVQSTDSSPHSGLLGI